MPNVSERRVCATMSVPRSAVRERPTQLREPRIDDVLAARLQRLIAQHPTFGYRRLWALLRFHEGLPVNRKAVYRVLVLKGWFVHQRRTTPRPRVQGRRSRATPSNERWAMDLTHIDCGAAVAALGSPVIAPPRRARHRDRSGGVAGHRADRGRRVPSRSRLSRYRRAARVWPGRCPRLPRCSA
jgi:HTH-like domain